MATPDGRKAHTPLAEGASRPPVLIILALLRSLAQWVNSYGRDSRRRAAQPETESSNAENESDKQKLMILLRTFFEVQKAGIFSTTSFPAKRCWKRKTSGSVPRSGSACRGLFRLLHALSPDAQDDIIARTEHML